MTDSRRVEIDDLKIISKKLVPCYFTSEDFYSLTVLALMTLTTYSRKKHRLSRDTKIQIAASYIPELIVALQQWDYIEPEQAHNLNNEFVRKRTELPDLLRAYAHVSTGTIKSKKKENKISSGKSSCAIM